MPLFLDLDGGEPRVVDRPTSDCYRLLYRAMSRHEAWMNDYATFHDLASAASAAVDLQALRGELGDRVALGAG